MTESDRPDRGKDQEREDQERAQSLWVAAGEYTGYGLTWALSVLLFLLGGWWLDGRFGTTPLLMILGAFLGAGAGFYSLYRHVVLDPRAKEKGVGNASERSEPDDPNRA